MASPDLKEPDIDWTKLRKSPTISAAFTTEDGSTILNVNYDEDASGGNPPDQFAAILDAPFRVLPGDKAEGLSFEVRGYGSAAYASIMLGYAKNRDVTLGYEAIFPLDSKEWKKVTLRWNDFVQNYLAWDPKNADDDTAPLIDPAKIALIGFGLGHYFHKHYPAHASFQIRKISLVDRIPERNPDCFSRGWSRTKAVLSQKQKLRILLIGDSTAQLGGDQSYGYFLSRKIKEVWGNDFEVANCGIGGHSVRGGTIILPRSLRAMPDPDLVFILFGANDAKSLGLRPGFNEAAFKSALEQLIDKVRAGTGGTADICLLSGIPRLLPDCTASAGTIEQIVNGVRDAAANKKTAFVDTFTIYLHLTAEERKAYYADTIHPKPAGQEFLGNLIFDKLRAENDGGR